MGVTCGVRVNNDFLLGTALIGALFAFMIGGCSLIKDANHNNLIETKLRIEACADIENPLERTLCLDK